MEDTITIRITPDLSAWLRSTARKTGVPVSRLVRDQLERARRETEGKSFMRLCGSIDGPADLSSRKGFSRK
ncbi:MAG: ribbon-helix-helix domain-containing protein [Terriglobales bacterium]